MEQAELNQLIQDYDGLFIKVLQRCSIFPGQAEYEDHLQELRTLFFIRAKQYPTRSHFERDNDITYLFRHLLWRLIDGKRKKANAVEEVTDEVLEYVPSTVMVEFPFESWDRFFRFYHTLSAKDQRKFEALLTEQNLSRQSRSRYRKYFRDNFRLFFEKL